MININNNEISDIKLGGEQVFAIYAGDRLVWQKIKKIGGYVFFNDGKALYIQGVPVKFNDQ